MKKTILFLVVAVLTTLFSDAQFTTFQTSLTDDTMAQSYITKASIIRPDSVQVLVEDQFSFNPNFIPALSIHGWDTLAMNLGQAQDTVVFEDSVHVATPGNYFVREIRQVLDSTAAFDTSNVLTVNIVHPIITPTISFVTITPTSDGAIISYRYNTGYAYGNAMIAIIVSPGDTILLTPVQIDQWSVSSDSGIATYQLTGWPSSYFASLKLTIANSVGADTTSKGWFETLPSGSPWVGQVDSSGTTDSVITVRFQLITNGVNSTVVTYCAPHGGSAIDSVVAFVAGQAGITPMYATFYHKNPSSEYDIWSCIRNTPICSNAVSVWTQAVTVLYALHADSITDIPSAHEVVLHHKTIVPSGTTGHEYSLQAYNADSLFNQPVAVTSPMKSFTQGIWSNITDTFSVQVGVTYRFRVSGYTDAGSWANSNVLVHTLVCPITITHSQVTVDTTNTNTLVSTATTVMVHVDTVGGQIITATDSMFVLKYANTTDILKDSTVFTVNQCTNAGDSIIYADTVSNTEIVFDTVVHEHSDTVGCPVAVHSQVTVDTTDMNALVSTTTTVAAHVDTVLGTVNKIITTTDSVFIFKYVNTTTVVKDSTALLVNQCDNSVISVTYRDTTASAAISYDTAVRETSDTVILIPDTILPDTIIITSFDTSAVGTTTVDLVWSIYTNDGVRRNVVTEGGSTVANLSGNARTAHVTGLTPDSSYVFNLTAQDSTGNWSTLATITVTTNAIPDPQAFISSIQSTVCFQDTASGGGWKLINVVGTNFYPGATYEGDYTNSGYQDTGTITYTNSTHCQVWVWNSYPDVVTFSITNMGALPSNSVETQIVDCGTTGIASLPTKRNSSVMRVYPNPVIDVVTVEIGQPAHYIITSVIGVEVQNGQLTKGQNRLSLRQLPAGVYIISTASGSAKIVKQ